MRIMIEIPEEFEKDYTADKFAELFQRCLADMCTCCGNYEQETAEMMENAFAESKIYDPDKVVEQLEKRRMDALRRLNENKGTAFGCASEWVYNAWNDAIEIVKGGGVDVN
jgi:hypothetical protein|nr:hypothetical protein [Roseburia inulinivorans]DAP47035.1 MAG TPA: hypothetical protein [Caudoviricetes sp.]